VITLKLDSKLAGSAVVSLQELASHLYANQGKRIVGIVELAHIERTEPAANEGKDPVVKVAIKAIEMARGDQEDALREAMAVLHRHRTATGTIDEELNPQLSTRTVDATLGNLDAIESARLRVAIEQWGEYIDRVMRGKLSLNQAREELQTVRKGLAAAIHWVA
jgi:hypothetical protein